MTNESVKNCEQTLKANYERGKSLPKDQIEQVYALFKDGLEPKNIDPKTLGIGKTTLYKLYRQWKDDSLTQTLIQQTKLPLNTQQAKAIEQASEPSITNLTPHDYAKRLKELEALDSDELLEEATKTQLRLRAITQEALIKELPNLDNKELIVLVGALK